MEITLKNKIFNRIIQAESTLLAALKQMDSIERKLLLVFNDDTFINLLSIGDIQRAIISNHSLDTAVGKILRSNTKFCHTKESGEEIKRKMVEFRSECMPILNDNKELVEVYFWEEMFPISEKRIKRTLDLPVVIMAGGKGSRLKPITNVLPKPLIPIGEKTIIEEIMDRFIMAGCNRFYLSVNYKADMIKHYFQTLNNQNYKIEYFEEQNPLGTVGSLYLLKGKINQTFFISNCDIIIEEDYGEIYNYHQENQNEITIISALKNYPIPYGTIETGNNGSLLKLREKPELTFQINSGMYIVESHVLKEIPDNEFFHITQLIENILHRKGKIGVFPISEGSWKDIGEWDEYYKVFLNK